MSKDKGSSYNHWVIPDHSGLATRKGSPSLLDSSHAHTRDRHETALDSFAPASPKKTEKKTVARPTEKTDEPITSKNYQEAYLDHRRSEDATMAEKKKTAQIERYHAQAKETAYIHEMRNQSNAIQEEMRIWESMRGQGTHDDQTIDGQIEVLRSRLANMPPQYQT